MNTIRSHSPRVLSVHHRESHQVFSSTRVYPNTLNGSQFDESIFDFDESIFDFGEFMMEHSNDQNPSNTVDPNISTVSSPPLEQMLNDQCFVSEPVGEPLNKNVDPNTPFVLKEPSTGSSMDGHGQQEDVTGIRKTFLWDLLKIIHVFSFIWYLHEMKSNCFQPKGYSLNSN